MKPTVRVVAAVLYDADSRVLVSRRPAGKALAGKWEFPGGKLEAGEAPSKALQRELHEELGIRVRASRRLMALEHEYPDRHVALSVWRVERYEGTPVGMEGQVLRWVTPTELRALELLPADAPIVDWVAKDLQR